MFTVIVQKSPYREDKVYKDPTRLRARQRAEAQSWLHGDCRVEWIETTAIVYASEYYAPRTPKVA